MSFNFPEINTSQENALQHSAVTKILLLLGTKLFLNSCL